MAHLYRYLVLAFVSIAVTTSISRGADPAPKQVEIQFTVFGTRAFQGLVYMTSTSTKPTPVKFYSVTLSAPYKYKGGQELKFYDGAQLAVAMEAMAAQKKANPGGPAPVLTLKPLAVCSIPEGLKTAVLLFFPSEDKLNGRLCEVFPMDMAVTKVPAGNMVIINASGRDFIGQVNSKIVTITKGVSAPFKAEDGKISVKMVRQEADFQGVVCADKWSLAKNQRRLWVLFPFSNDNEVLPDTRCLTDSLPIEEQGTKTAQAN